MVPIWFGIALSHLSNAEDHHTALLAARAGQQHVVLGAALEREFLSSMQVIVAGAIALDAFYASVKPHVALAPGTTEAWQRNGTARYSQIAEVLRRGLRLKEDTFNLLSEMLMEIYDLRDEAVHPPHVFATAVRHPDLIFSTERRFVVFSHNNARRIIGAALAFTMLLSRKTVKDMPQGLADLCKETSKLIAPACQDWRAKYGPFTVGDIEDDP